MLTLTQKAIEEFDNPHDFERMCADILNSLGHRDVTPIAPRGGSDGGEDITFTTESNGKGLACATLRKDSEVKFNEDFAQRQPGEYEKHYFFTNRYLTSGQKVKFAKFCLDNLNAELVVQDGEALRSLLDSALHGVRKRYLQIDDDNSARVRKSIVRILKYPCILPPANFKDRTGIAEGMITRPMHREIYYYIIDVDDEELKQIPIVGGTLHGFKEHYYNFCLELNGLTELCKEEIGKQPLTSYQFIHGWTIYFKYFLLRRFGNSEEETQKKISTNYDITYEDCERVFEVLGNTPKIAEVAEHVNTRWGKIVEIVTKLTKEIV